MTKAHWRKLDVAVGLLIIGVSVRSAGTRFESGIGVAEFWAVAAGLSGVLLILLPEAGALLTLILFGLGSLMCCPVIHLISPITDQEPLTTTPGVFGTWIVVLLINLYACIRGLTFRQLRKAIPTGDGDKADDHQEP